MEEPTHTYQLTTKAFDEEMLMISVIVKNKRIPNALIDDGSRVIIITNTLRRKLGLKRMEPTPFTIKMADQRKVMAKGITRDVRLDVGNIVIWTSHRHGKHENFFFEENLYMFLFTRKKSPLFILLLLLNRYKLFYFTGCRCLNLNRVFHIFAKFG